MPEPSVILIAIVIVVLMYLAYWLAVEWFERH